MNDSAYRDIGVSQDGYVATVDHADLIEEIDLNPVIVHPQGEGLTVVDALIVKRDPEESRI